MSGIRSFFHKNITYLLSFLIPFGIMLGIFIVNEVYPFGDESFMHSDMYHQYVPFLSELMRKVREGESLLYSWNVGAGSNFPALFAYYMASPFNWLALLFPEQYLIEFMSYAVILKIGLAGAAFCWYLTQHFSRGNLFVPHSVQQGFVHADSASSVQRGSVHAGSTSSVQRGFSLVASASFCSQYVYVPFAVLYAMSGYVAAYNWNVMWIDCIVLFPLIAAGLETLVSEGKCRLYCITLTLCILSNYYISIMICIFLVLYFAVLLICQPSFRTVDAASSSFEKSAPQPAHSVPGLRSKFLPELLPTLLRFTAYSALAGGMAAVLLLPVYSALQLTEFTQFNFPDQWKTYFPVFDMLGRHCINVAVETGLDHWPNLYCGAAVLLLLPLYLINSEIPLREKAPKVALLGLLLISFQTNVLNFIWHGFNYPNSLPCRQSFLYIFLLLTVCAEAVLRIRSCSLRTIGCSFCLTLGSVFLFEKFTENAEAYEPESFLLTAVLIGVYALFLYFYHRRRLPGRFLVLLLLLTVGTETAVNMYTTSCSVTGRSAYLKHQDSYTALLERLESRDPGFYRIEKTKRKTKNDGTFTGYATASLFSSTANGNLVSFYEKMGMQNSKVYYCYDGATPLASSLLSVKYLFSESDREDPFLYTLVDSEGEIFLYEYNFALPAGFSISDPESLDRILKQDYSDPIERQIDLGFALGASEPLFEKIKEPDSDTNSQPENRNLHTSQYRISDGGISFHAETAGHYYAYAENKKIDTLKMESDLENKTFTKIKKGYICDLGYFPAGSTVSLNSEDDSDLNLALYRLNETALQEIHGALDGQMSQEIQHAFTDQTLQITEYDSTHLRGEITMQETGNLVLTVPAEPGWTVSVNGTEAETETFADAFLMLSLEEGSHTIEMTYFPEGLGAGIIVSLISLGIFLFLTVSPHKTAQKRKLL